MKWYNLTEKERIKQIYSKVSIQDFWDWWSDKETKFMEVRILNYKLIKDLNKKYKLPYSSSGVYVCNGTQLKNVIAYTRDKATIWFGVNPRKKNKSQKGWNTFGSADKGGSGDINVEEVKFLFVDIDRIIKDGIATSKDLEHCDILANCILERLETEKWNNSYIKICSGHGLQLLIKFDLGLTLPDIEFDKIELEDNKVIFKPIIDVNFIKTKNVIKEGIGKDLLVFTRKIIKKKKLLVEIDKSCFRIAQVGALHCSKNFKYNTYRWRGITKLVNSINNGLADYVWSKESDIKSFKSNTVFVKRRLQSRDKIIKGKLMKHELIQFVLNNNFSYGEINNKLWFQIKCLIRDSKINVSESEYLTFVRLFETKLNGLLSPNLPDKKFEFNRDIINDFCLNQRLPPLYTVYGKRVKHNNYLKEEIDFNVYKYVIGEMLLDDEKQIKEDMEICKNKLKSKEFGFNSEIIGQFINALINKYDIKTAKYLHKHWFYRTFEFC